MKPVSAFKTRASPKASETPTPGDAGRLKRSGRQRPKFQRILDQIRPGDVIVVWKLDRLARSTRALLNTMTRSMTQAAKSNSFPSRGPIFRERAVS